MSKFSSYLRGLFDRSGESISSVSRAIGAERTSIHKALSDERVLSYKVVQALARHFNLPLEERQEFFRLYDILLQGEDNYRNRHAVADLFNSLSSTSFKMPPPPEVPQISVGDQLIKGEFAVRGAIRSVLIHETNVTPEAEFHLFCPACLDLTTELMELWLNGRQFSVNQLFCFSSASDDAAVQNIRVLRQIVPLCLASRGRYRPYYFCERPGTAMINPLSCYIVTPNYLIQFSRDLSTAQIQASRALVEYYRGHFRNLLLSCEPLAHCSTDIRDTLQDFIAQTSPDHMNTLMSQPCPGRYFTPEFIAKYMKSSNIPYKQMFSLVNKRFSVLRNMERNYTTIFSEKGLEGLARTGVLCDMPDEFVPPLELSDARDLLMRLREEIADGTVQGLIAHPMYLQVPDYLVVDVDARTGTHFYTTNDFVYGAYCCNIHITDESICKMFLDFVQALPGSPFVYSQEDTLRLLDQQIAAIPLGSS